MLQQSKNFTPDKFLYVDEDGNGSISFEVSIPDSKACYIGGWYTIIGNSIGHEGISDNITIFEDKSIICAPKYNGDKITLSFKGLMPGISYTLTGFIFQANKEYPEISTSSDNYSTGAILCDNYLCKGKIQSATKNDDGTITLMISKGIKNLRDVFTITDIVHNDNYKENYIACAEIRNSNGLKACIKSYNYYNGELVIIDNGYTGSFTAANELDYKIYTSYIKDEVRGYVVRQKEELTNDSYCAFDSKNGTLRMYTELKNNAYIYKRYKAYYNDYTGTQYDHLIFDSGKIYGNNNVPDCEIYAVTTLADTERESREVKIEIGTVDGDVLNFEYHMSSKPSAGEIDIISNLNVEPSSEKLSFDIDFNTLDSSLIPDSKEYGYIAAINIYRKELDKYYFVDNMKLEFKKSLKYHVEVEDYTAPINEEYHYHIELTMSNSNDTYILDTDDTERYCTGACIYELETNVAGFAELLEPGSYRIGKEYRFIDAETSTNIKYNYGINTYETNNKPIVSRSDTNYRSGTFSSTLINYEDEIRQFEHYILNNDSPMLLCLPSGDRIIIKINGEPTRTYDNETKISSISFDWVEVEDFKQHTIMANGFYREVT